MSLRLRLIVAFFVLSVVPLGAVTIYTYLNNVSAVRDAAAREADLLTGELTQRMQLVTAQLSERVEHLMDLPQAEVTVSAKADEPKPATAARASRPAASSTAATATPAPAANGNDDMTGMDNKVAVALGEAAMLLNNVELRGMRPGGAGPRRDTPRPPGDLTFTGRGRGARDTTPGSNRTAGTGAGAGAGSTAVIVGANAGASTSTSTSANERAPRLGSTGDLGSVPHFTPPQPQSRFRQGGRGARSDAPDTPATPATAAGASTTPPGSPTPPGAPPAPGASPVPPGVSPPGVPLVPTTIVDARDPTHITIDMAPIWRDVLHQIVPDGKIENLSPEERQRVAREVNQRLLGIKQGLQISAAGLQKQAEDIRKEAETETKTAGTSSADTKAAAKDASTAAANAAPTAAPSTAPATTTPAPPSPMKKVTALTGNHLNVQMEKNGQVVQQVNAEINLPNVLATVFSTTRRDRGEVPFAIGKDGHIYTPSDDDRARVESLGLAAPAASDAPSTSIKGDWIVVTSADPSGSGLRFGIARPVGDSMAQLRKTAARNAGFGLGFIAIALVGIVPLSGRLTRNLSKLTEGVERIAHGDYGARVPVKSNDEIGQLATAFNQMAADVETHQRAAVEQERIKRELELGRQIQHEMLPHAAMQLGLLEIQGVSVPAREVGGDFFNYFEVPGGQVAMLVGDVSGKGVGAALLMANIQAALRTRLALGQDLSAIADAIDHDIEDNTPGSVYATLFVGLFDPKTRQLQYVNAGHHPQYVLRPGKGLERMASTGLPVGLIAGRGYRADRTQLGAGDLLFFYTDGCVEAESDAGDMFGSDRLEAIVSSAAATSPEQVLQRVEASIKSFRGKREPFDDETMMAVRVG